MSQVGEQLLRIDADLRKGLVPPPWREGDREDWRTWKAGIRGCTEAAGLLGLGWTYEEEGVHWDRVQVLETLLSVQAHVGVRPMEESH